jgi:hypothetical protein
MAQLTDKEEELETIIMIETLLADAVNRIYHIQLSTRI